jgi:hypothetical protein
MLSPRFHQFLTWSFCGFYMDQVLWSNRYSNLMQPSYLSISLLSAVLRTISDLFELVPPGRSVPGVPRLAQHGAGSGWAVSVQLHASVTAKGSPGSPGGALDECLGPLLSAGYLVRKISKICGDCPVEDTLR